MSRRCLRVIREWDNERAKIPALTDPELEMFRRKLFVLIQRAVFVGKSSRAQYLNAIIRAFDNAFTHVTWASFNWDCIFSRRRSGTRSGATRAWRSTKCLAWLGGSARRP